jgi:hypothetical protein
MGNVTTRDNEPAMDSETVRDDNEPVMDHETAREDRYMVEILPFF